MYTQKNPIWVPFRQKSPRGEKEGERKKRTKGEHQGKNLPHTFFVTLKFCRFLGLLLFAQPQSHPQLGGLVKWFNLEDVLARRVLLHLNLISLLRLGSEPRSNCQHHF